MKADREAVRARLLALGFDEVRFAPVTGSGDLVAENAALRAWLEAGHQADMAWMQRTAEKRANPRHIVPDAGTIIALGVNYWDGGKKHQETSSKKIGANNLTTGRSGAVATEPDQNPGPGIPKPIWARYALHSDYHDTLKPALAAAGRVLVELCGVAPAGYRYYVDTGPVLERGWAARAGLGFVGKNAMLISPRHGNWLLLAAIITSVKFEPDGPLLGEKLQNRDFIVKKGVGALCGKCTRCLDACPTAAFAAPGVVDARRCVSYQTIENRGIIPRELRAGIGQRIFGCDVCLEVCPWNRFAQAGRRTLLEVRGELADLALGDILRLTPERFAVVFRKTAVKRLKLTGLLRNACVAAGNLAGEEALNGKKRETTGRVDEELLTPLVALASHVSPLVRAHAVWAVHRHGEGARLAAARAAETDVTVLAEYMAEGEGFEPPGPCGPAVFKTAAIDHSATPPSMTYKLTRKRVDSSIDN
jgi:epoxyqueuosine reductase